MWPLPMIHWTPPYRAPHSSSPRPPEIRPYCTGTPSPNPPPDMGPNCTGTPPHPPAPEMGSHCIWTPPLLVISGAITGDLFKFVHFRSPHTGADIWLPLKQVKSLQVGYTHRTGMLSCYRPQGKVMFSHVSVILSTIGPMPTRLLLILVGYSVTLTPPPARQGSVRILLECFLASFFLKILWKTLVCSFFRNLAREKSWHTAGRKSFRHCLIQTHWLRKAKD